MERTVFFAGEPGVLRPLKPSLQAAGAAVEAFQRLADFQAAVQRDAPAAILLAGYLEDGNAVAGFGGIVRPLRRRSLVILGRDALQVREDLLLGGAADVMFSGVRARAVVERLLEIAGLRSVPRPAAGTELPATLFVGGRSLDGRVLELSPRAATVRLREPLPPNAPLKLRLELAPEAHVTVHVRFLSRRDAAGGCFLHGVVLVGLSRAEEAALSRATKPAPVKHTPPLGLAPAPAGRVFDAPEVSLGPLVLAGPERTLPPPEKTPGPKRPDEALAALFSAAIDAAMAAQAPPPLAEDEFLASHALRWPVLPSLAAAVGAIERVHGGLARPDGASEVCAAALRLASEMTALEHDVFRARMEEEAPSEAFACLRALVRQGAGRRLRLAAAEEQARHLLGGDAGDVGDVEIDESALETLLAESEEWLGFLRGCLARSRTAAFPAEPAELRALELAVSGRLGHVRELGWTLRRRQAQPTVVAPEPVPPPPAAPRETVLPEAATPRISSVFRRLFGRTPPAGTPVAAPPAKPVPPRPPAG